MNMSLILRLMVLPVYIVHRIGRTGRFGRVGFSINFISGNRDMDVMEAIINKYNMQISALPVNDLEEMEKALKKAMKSVSEAMDKFNKN